jgi:hypothetical protein
VAHEFAHILSGTYVTATVSCLLFSIYPTLATGSEGPPGRRRRALLGTSRRSCCAGCSSSCSSPAGHEPASHGSGARGRRGHRALHATADLAQALRMGRTRAAAPIEGPPCASTRPRGVGWFVGRWQATHPPWSCASDASALAHVAPDDSSQFDERRRALDERDMRCARRRPPPGADPRGSPFRSPPRFSRAPPPRS